VEVFNALPKLKAALPNGKVSLDVFTWDVILGELARYNLGPAKGNDDVLWTFWAIRQAMHADDRYVALMNHAKVHEKNERRVARAKKRYDRDRKIVHAYVTTGNPTRALNAVGN
jgi:hypothetical protein